MCEKLMDANHALWIKWNSFEQDRDAHGLREIEDVRLEEAVRRQYYLGTEGLHTSDHYLFNKPRLELWSYPGEYVRSWLDTVLISRGEHASAKQEMSQYFGDKRRCRKRTAPGEMELHRKRRRETQRTGKKHTTSYTYINDMKYNFNFKIKNSDHTQVQW